MHPAIAILRPKQWLKNIFVFAPLFFAGRFKDLDSWYLAVAAAACFLCISCLVYVCNDLEDMEEDRAHPRKRDRPLASGALKIRDAGLIAWALAAFGVLLIMMLPIACALIASIYIGINLIYTLRLKRYALIDIFVIASCYVLRVLMGCYALQVMVSPWIILATFLLALFLGFGKRYHEIGYEDYAKVKPNLQHYSPAYLDRLVVICAGASLMTYAIYAAEVANRIGNVGIIYTVVFVAFGLFRYMQSIYVFHHGGEPESIILKDKWQLGNLAAWLATTMWLMF